MICICITVYNRLIENVVECAFSKNLNLQIVALFLFTIHVIETVSHIVDNDKFLYQVFSTLSLQSIFKVIVWSQ